MISGFIAKKGKMTSVFNQQGQQIPVTVCHTIPLLVTQIKTESKDGYQAVQLAYPRCFRSSPVLSAKTKIKPQNKTFAFHEFKITGKKVPQVGDKITIDSVFSPEEQINVTGISKGRGFSGVIKRHGFHRQPVTRGQSDRTRAPGAIGAQTPGRVLKGKKMPGHYGVAKQTITGLKVVSIDKDHQTITISGPLPGHFNSVLILSKVL